jgi:transposase
MAWQPKHWTAQQLEERRLAAGRLLRRGHLSQAEVARRVGVSEASVSRWARQLHEAGGSTRGLKGVHDQVEEAAAAERAAAA